MWNQNKFYNLRSVIDRKLVKQQNQVTETVLPNEQGRFDLTIQRAGMVLTNWQWQAMVNELASIDSTIQGQVVDVLGGPLLIRSKF